MIIDYLPAGSLIQQTDRRQTMILGIVINSLSTMAFFLRFLGSVGHAVFSIARQFLVTRAVRTSVCGRAISLFDGVVRIELFIGPALGGMLAVQYGLCLLFIAYTLVCLASFVVIVLARDGFETQSQAPAVEQKSASGLR